MTKQRGPDISMAVHGASIRSRINFFDRKECFSVGNPSRLHAITVSAYRLVLDIGKVHDHVIFNPANPIACRNWANNAIKRAVEVKSEQHP